MNVHEQRQQTKQRHEAYREMARLALEKLGVVSPHASVTEDADKTGAFVECTVWVPRSEIEEK